MMSENIKKPAPPDISKAELSGSGVSAKTRAAAEKYKNVPDDIAPVQQADPDRPAGEAPTRFGDWEKKGRCIDF